MAVPTLVQHVSTCNMLGGTLIAGTDFRVRFPELFLSGNLGIVAFQYGPTGGGATTFSVTDDLGNAWTLGPTTFDAVKVQGAQIFYRPNMSAGARVIKIRPTGGVNVQFISAVGSEYYNCATASVNDGAGSGANTNGTGSTSIAAGLLGTLTTGDLIYQYVALDSTTNNAGLFSAGSQANITWQLLSADLQDGQAAQYGVYNATTSFSPTMSMANSNQFNTVAMAFKSASAGTAPSATAIRVVGKHHLSFPRVGNTFGASATTNPFTAQVPQVGNLLICAHSTGNTNFAITAITDSLGYGWEQSGSGIFNASPGANDGGQIWYSANRLSPSAAASVTISFTDITASDASCIFYDVVNAAAVQNDLERTGSATGDQTVGAATITTCSITPTTKNGLVIFLVQQEFNTEVGITSPVGAIFDSIEFDGMNQDGPENLDQNGGWAHYYNADLSTLTAIWSLVNTSTDPMRQWGAYAAAFKSPQEPVMANVDKPYRGSRTRPAAFRPGLAR
jgi:hypothetical protein